MKLVSIALVGKEKLGHGLSGIPCTMYNALCTVALAMRMERTANRAWTWTLG